MAFEKAIIIRDKTRLEQLIERFNSKAQARFYIESSGGDFDFYVTEHQKFYESLDVARKSFEEVFKVKVIDRSFLPTFIFTEADLIVVIGQDGLVANTAKYVKGQPIVAINPDPDRYDGVLLPFDPQDCNIVISMISNNTFTTKSISMAEAVLNDGQRLLAFNDFYIGAASHVSSRYQISFEGITETQSSSGVLISTGAGSTGWLSSVYNMAANVRSEFEPDANSPSLILPWDSRELIFVVREPFVSKVTSSEIGYGHIRDGEQLEIMSSMTANGVIFSDGIEADYLSFNTGTSVRIGIADEVAILVEPQ